MKVFKQRSDFDCGEMAVRFAAVLCGNWEDEGNPTELYPDPKSGTPHEEIVKWLEELGLNPVVRVGEIFSPCIVNYLVGDHFGVDGHYGVVLLVAAERLLIYDPLDGRIKEWERDEFEWVWKAFRYPPDKWSVSFGNSR